jgi:hypothetical protein
MVDEDEDIELTECEICCQIGVELSSCNFCGATVCYDCISDHEPECDDKEE